MDYIEDWFGYSTHSLERAIERIIGLDPPYSNEQLDNIKIFLQRNIEWHPFKMRWVIPDYNAELIIKNHSVVTVIIKEQNTSAQDKPITEYQKKYSKRYGRLKAKDGARGRK